MIFCFLRASFLRFCSSYLYLPMSRILQTGGEAVGEISTRSKPASSALRRAVSRSTTPKFSPTAPIRRTVRESIWWLTRGPSLDGGAGWSKRGMYQSPLVVDPNDNVETHTMLPYPV